MFRTIFNFPTCVRFFQGVSAAVVVLLTSLVLFVASTRLIRLGVGAIDSPDQSRQGFEQYDTSEVLEKGFSVDFLMACRQKILIFGIFKTCIDNFVYTDFENERNYFKRGSPTARPSESNFS